jgi:hypothetical protein
MRRDNHACRYCGATAPDVKLTIDHVTPTTLGGSDDPSNLVTACADCNAGKSATPPDAALVTDVDQRAVKWAQAMQVAIERRAAELAAERGRTEAFDNEWRRWNAGGEEIPRDPGWRSSVLRLLAAGLDEQFLAEAVGIAMRSRARPGDTWRYFCGVCWREVDRIQAIAREVADVDAPEGSDQQDPWSYKMVSETIKFTAAAGDVMPQHQATCGLHPDFPSIELAERFVIDLAKALEASPDVVPLAVDALWDGMSDAYDVFVEGSLDPESLTEERTRAAFQNSTVWMFHRIGMANSGAGV